MNKKWWKLVKLGKNAFSACQWYKKRGYEHILDPKNCTQKTDEFTPCLFIVKKSQNVVFINFLRAFFWAQNVFIPPFLILLVWVSG